MATRTGMDVTAAAETIGRALDIPSQGMAALSKQGFRFSDEQKQLVKYLENTGRTSEAQRIVLGALEETYKGAAAAARGTFGGALKAVQNTLSDLMTGNDGSLSQAKEGLEELNRVLADPQTKQAFAQLTNSVIQGLTFIARHAWFVVDAIEGVKRAAGMVADTGIAVFASAQGAAKKLEESTGGIGSKLLKQLPGLQALGFGMEQLAKSTDSAAESFAVAGEAWDNIFGHRLGDLLPSDAAALAAASGLPTTSAPAANDSSTSNLEALAKEKAAQEALAKAEAERQKQLEAARKAALEAAQRQQEAIQSELTALERAAKVWGMNATEVKLYDLAVQGANQSQLAQAKTQLELVENLQREQQTRENYLTLVQSLQTEEERRKETLQEQFKILQNMENLTGALDSESFKRLALSTFESPAPGMAFASNELDPSEKFKEAEKLQEQWYQSQLEQLNEYREQRADLAKGWDEKEKEIKKQHEEALANIEKAKREASYTALKDLLEQMTELQNSESKKQRTIGKAAAIAQAGIKTYEAAAGALASASQIPVVGWIMGPIAAASITALGLANVAKISGMAHSGIDSIPQTGTWLLEKGERVTTAKTSAKLDATLERIGREQRGNDRRSSGRSAPVINQTIQVTGTVDNHTASQLYNEAARKQRISSARFG